MKDILLYLWQLPQNLLGLIVRLFYYKNNSLRYKDKLVRICSGFPGGISLGETIIVKRYPYDKETWNSVKHEYGHTVQSKKLGWLYLLVIGLPSGIGYLWDEWFHSKWDWRKSYYWYYNLPWEKQADEYGGVDRGKK